MRTCLASVLLRLSRWVEPVPTLSDPVDIAFTDANNCVVTGNTIDGYPYGIQWWGGP
jgi:hypothetical protein